LGLQTQVPDHLTVGAGYQGVEVLRLLGDPLAPHLHGRQRKLEGIRDHPRAAKDAVQRLIVVRLGVTGWLSARFFSPFTASLRV
jgi:hypothetical protein